jgi:hypothetical protein
MNYELDAAESRIMRRLGRLFRIERTGGFDRRPTATVRRLVERRGALIDRLIALDDRRGAVFAPRSGGLDEALADLRREVERARPHAQTRAQRLTAELRLRRGGGVPTGLRGGAGGQLLGKG